MKADEKSTGNVDKVHIGVDVSKAKLDIYVPATKDGGKPTTTEVGNDRDGFRALRDMARKVNGVVCVEPTGGYEKKLIAFMHKFDVDVAYTNATRVRNFAKAEGNYSKNDEVDAELISRFADKIGVRVLEQADKDSEKLNSEVKFRQKMINVQTIMIGLLDTETDPEIVKKLKQIAALMTKTIKKAERSCIKIIKDNERMNNLYRRFVEIGGVSDITASTIIAGLPEIGKLPDAKLNRLVGLSPEERQSGTREWKRKIWGGRMDVRNALYNSSFAAIQWNSILSSYYYKKKAEGHPHNWCMVPVMRKLLSLLNRIARDPNFAPTQEPESTKKKARAGRKPKVV